MMDLRDRIRLRLTELGMSQREASLKAGLNSHFLKRIFDDPGKSIQVSSLEALATALETTAVWLLSGYTTGNNSDPELDKVIKVWDRLNQKEQENLAGIVESMAKNSDG